MGGQGDNRGWDVWLASPTQWTWVWVSYGRWWWTGRPGVLRSMGSQGVRHDWVTELNWTEYLIVLSHTTILKLFCLFVSHFLSSCLLSSIIDFCRVPFFILFSFPFVYIFNTSWRMHVWLWLIWQLLTSEIENKILIVVRKAWENICGMSSVVLGAELVLN